MKSNYKRLGDYIQLVDERNKGLKVDKLLGININKHFMPSVANIVGTDLSNYKIVQKNQFACNRMHVGRDYRIPIAISDIESPFIVSPAYDVFEIKDSKILMPDYLMMWFSRLEFDRNAWFYTDADVRGGLAWKAFEDMQLPIPSIEKQREIVEEYNTIQNRITLNQNLIQKLEATAQAIYKEWFVDFEFPNEEEKPYKTNGGEMVWCEELGKEIPKGWKVMKIGEEVSIIRGASPRPIDEYMSKDNTGVPWVKISDATDCSTRYLFKTNQYISLNGVSNSRKVQTDTLILSNSASPGLPRILMIDACIHDGWLAFDKYKRISKEILLEFLIYNRQEIVSLSNGSVFNNLKTDILKEFRIIVPNESVVDRITIILKKLNNQLLTCAKYNKTLNLFLELLLSKLATIEN
ncbi:MAG: restriction endonuclease subunit S [Bacteroidales bacterium]|nr:restriction endonuclease subunit S [Bacteroidales bacterium]